MKFLIRPQTPKVLNATVKIRKWISNFTLHYTIWMYLLIHVGIKIIHVSKALSFCFVSTNHQQPGRRLPSDYWQESSKLPSTSLNTPPDVRRNGRTHASWQYKDLFLSMKSSQYDPSDTRWCEIRAQPTFFQRVIYE